MLHCLTGLYISMLFFSSLPYQHFIVEKWMINYSTMMYCEIKTTMLKFIAYLNPQYVTESHLKTQLKPLKPSNQLFTI